MTKTLTNKNLCSKNNTCIKNKKRKKNHNDIPGRLILAYTFYIEMCFVNLDTLRELIRWPHYAKEHQATIFFVGNITISTTLFSSCFLVYHNGIATL